MSSIDELKQELLYQKSAIEAKRGTVMVAGTNPSPKEISDGIDSIPIDTEVADVKSANAEPYDVLEGKTFFAGDVNIKTGTFSLDNALKHICIYRDNVKTSEDRYSITIPSYITDIRSYFMSKNKNNIDIYFHSEILRVDNYAFNECSNMRFHGFNDMDELLYLGMGAFCNCNPEDFDLSGLPKTLMQIQQKAFFNVPRDGIGIIIPDKTNTIGTGAFACDNRVLISSFSFPMNAYATSTLPSTMLQNIACHCDFETPTKITNINAGFNIGGCFDNVTFGPNVKNIYDNVFGSINDTDPISDFFMQSATFLNPTPPSSLGKKIFALQNLEHDFKIFVPDESVEAYSAMTNFSTYYSGRIFPMSQKP